MSEQDAVERLIEENTSFGFSDYDGRSFWECDVCGARLWDDKDLANLRHTDSCLVSALEASQQEVERLREELEAILGGDWDLQATEETDD